MKRRKWAEITARVNEIGECDREIMEVIKKWSDLKCDTKRKVAALRTGVSVSLRLARSNIELSPMEVIVESILELDKRPWEATQRSRSRSHGDDQEAVCEDEEEEDGGFVGMGSVNSSPSRGLDVGGIPATTSGSGVASEVWYDNSKTGGKHSKYSSWTILRMFNRFRAVVCICPHQRSVTSKSSLYEFSVYFMYSHILL